MRRRERPSRATIARTFARINVGMWVENHGYYSGFRCPRDGVDRMALTAGELDIIEGLWNDGQIHQDRHCVKSNGGYAVSFYWAVGMCDCEISERDLFMLIARGVVMPRFDTADNVYFELSPYAKRLPMSTTSVKRLGRSKKEAGA